MTEENAESLRAVSGRINRKIVPHVRVGRERWTKRAKRYRADQDWIEKHVRGVFDRAEIEQCPAPYRVIVDAYFAPAKSTGKIPKTAGDIDNVAKAILDALQRAGCTPDDCHLEHLVASKKVADSDFVDWCVYWAEEVDP
jgi:Holliday junction resolvase RusA-like endonuclease